MSESLKPSTRWSASARDTWGPYWDAMFPPAMVTGWINWKRGSTGVNCARSYWEQREYLRLTYESVYGADPANWPSQHPGVVLFMGRSDQPACLRCHYFGRCRSQLRALDLACRHETSSGEFCYDGYRYLGPNPEPEQPPLRLQRNQIPPLLIADRYAQGRRRSLG